MARLGPHAIRPGRLVLPLPSRERRGLHPFSGVLCPPRSERMGPKKGLETDKKAAAEMELGRAGPEEVRGPEGLRGYSGGRAARRP